MLVRETLALFPFLTAATLIMFLCTVDLSVAENSNINAYKSETGEFMYRSALSCSYSSLYFSHPYNTIRAGYKTVDDKKCCYLQETRHRCCLQMDNKNASATCRCDPSVTCGMTTSTTTTTIVPTTTIITLPPTTSRTTVSTTAKTVMPTTTRTTVLNCDTISNNYLKSGMFEITFPNGSLSICNAVYTKANVSGVYKRTILTSNNCKYFIQSHTDPLNACLIIIGNQKYKIREPTFTLVETDRRTAFIDVAQNESSILDEVAACQKNVTYLYNTNTMQGHVDLADCKMFSWGVLGTKKYGLTEVALAIISRDECLDTETSFYNGLCFKTTDGKNLVCSSMFFSVKPVYCKAIETQEQILIGVTSRCARSTHIWVHSPVY